MTPNIKNCNVQVKIETKTELTGYCAPVTLGIIGMVIAALFIAYNIPRIATENPAAANEGVGLIIVFFFLLMTLVSMGDIDQKTTKYEVVSTENGEINRKRIK